MAAEKRDTPHVDRTQLRIAYLSLQAVVDGQDSWAAVNEVIGGWESRGWTVDRHFVRYSGSRIPGLFSRMIEMYRVQRLLVARLREYDLLYVRAHPLAGLAVRAARRAGVPVVQECNGPLEDLFIAWPLARLGRPLFEWLQLSQYETAASVITVTDGLRSWLLGSTKSRSVVTIGNGANVDAFSNDAPRRPGLPERYAVFFGQFAAWQGIGVLLGAIDREEWPTDVALVFVGDGAMRHLVEAAAAREPSRVIYLGKLPYAEVGGVVAQAVASFIPIVADGSDMLHSPLKLYESMACGVPVIASDTPGVAEIVRAERCGLLFAPGSADGAATALRELVEAPNEAAAMGQRGREAAVERYSWKARASQRADVVESAAKRG